VSALRPPAVLERLHERFLANAQQSVDSFAAARAEPSVAIWHAATR
jgi:hypothetical protein